MGDLRKKCNVSRKKCQSVPSMISYLTIVMNEVFINQERNSQ
jgi:hypothetical protein